MLQTAQTRILPALVDGLVPPETRVPHFCRAIKRRRREQGRRQIGKSSDINVFGVDVLVLAEQIACGHVIHVNVTCVATAQH
jgi:hypothetical protein